jgi:hypothetical protein
MARRGMAVFLAPIIFLPAVNLMANEHQINSVQSEPTPTIALFPVFHEVYHMPLPVAEMQLCITQHSTAQALPAREEDTSCQDTVHFLSHEKHEVVQLVFFLLSVGKLVDDCTAIPSGPHHTLHTSKDSQLKMMQQCAELLQNLPCTYPRFGVPQFSISAWNYIAKLHRRIDVLPCR